MKKRPPSEQEGCEGGRHEKFPLARHVTKPKPLWGETGDAIDKGGAPGWFFSVLQSRLLTVVNTQVEDIYSTGVVGDKSCGC